MNVHLVPLSNKWRTRVVAAEEGREGEEEAPEGQEGEAAAGGVSLMMSLVSIHCCFFSLVS